MASIIIKLAKQYRQALTKVTTFDHVRAFDVVLAKRIEIAEMQGRAGNVSEKKIVFVLKDDTRIKGGHSPSVTLALRGRNGRQGELFEKVSKGIFKESEYVFEKKYLSTGKDGHPEYTQRVIGSIKGGRLSIYHAEGTQVPEIMAYLGRLWEIIHNKTEKMINRKTALAQYEWWFYQANPMGAAGAAIGDAMSIIAQIAMGIKLRNTYVHQDFDALSLTLDDYVTKRTKELKTGDEAQLSNENLGGIDLSPARMNLKTQNAGGEIKFHLDPAMLRQLQNAPGFVPVIINIKPLKSLNEFLGLD